METVNQLGKQLDQLGSAKIQKSIDRTAQRVEIIGRKTEKTAAVVDGASKRINKSLDKTSKNSEQMSAVVDKSTKKINKGFEQTTVTVKKSTDKIGQDVIGVGVKTTETSKVVDKNTKDIGQSFEKAAVKGAASIDLLTGKLKEFEHQRATATVDVNIAMAEAKIRIIKAELRKLSTVKAQQELSALGLVAASTAAAVGGGGAGSIASVAGGGGGGGGGRAAGSVAAAFWSAGKGAIFFAAKAAILLPIIVSLGGAIGALLGSLGAATMGVGALGVGGLGGLAVGLGAIAFAAVPAVKAMKESTKAQDSYNKAVSQYGDQSAQAIKAKEAMDKAFAKAPKGTKQFGENKAAFGKAWQKASAPAQSDFVGILNDGILALNRLLPTFANIANSSMSAARKGVQSFLAVFQTSEFKGIFRTLGSMFDQSFGPFMRAMGNLALFFGRIARAATPNVIKMFTSFEGWTSGLAKSAANQGRVTDKIRGYIEHTRAWGKLIRSTGHLMATVFGAGADEGKTTVERLADTFDRWSDWIDHNREKVQDFFKKSIDAVSGLAQALAAITPLLTEIGTTLMPLLQSFGTLTGMLSSTGLLGPLLAGLGAAKFGKIGAKALGIGKGAKAAGTVAGAAGATGTAAKILNGSKGAAKFGKMGSLAGTVGKGALGKIALPIAAGFALSDFATTDGNFGNKLQGVASGFTGGIIHKPMSDTEIDAEAALRSGKLSGRTKEAQGKIRSIQRQLDATTSEKANAGQWTGGPQSTTVNVQPKVTGKERKILEKTLSNLKVQIKPEIRNKSIHDATSKFDDIVNAFQLRWDKSGSKAADKGLFSGIKRQMKGLDADGKRTMKHAAAGWTAQLENGTDKQKSIARRLKKYIVDQYDAMGKRVAVVNGQILSGSRKEWSSIRKSLSGEAERAAQEVSKSFTDMQRQAAGSLVAMGFSRADANKLVRGLEKGGKAGKAASQKISMTQKGTKGPVKNEGLLHATGGRISGGIGLMDNVMIGPRDVGANGELVLNRHTERDVNAELQQMGRPPLGERLRHEVRPHSQAMSGSPAKHAKGGRTGGLGGGISGAVSALLNKFPGLSVTSTTGGGHAKNSYHYRGMAADIGGPAGMMNAAAAWIQKTMGGSLTEGIHNPNLSIKNGKNVPSSFWGPTTWAGHANHIHLAIAGALGKMAGLAGGGGIGGVAEKISLKPGKSKRGGAPGAASTRAQEIIAKGMETKINEQLVDQMGALGGGGAIAGASSGAAAKGGAYNARSMASLWKRAGGPGKIARLMGAIGMAESTGNPGAHNPSGASGLWQILGNPFPGNPMDPMTNARMAVAKYKTQGLGAWEAYTNGNYKQFMATGGRLGGSNAKIQDAGWNKKGGQFTVNKPTVFGAGEAGAETVRISPKNAAGKQDRKRVALTIGTINNYADGDIEKAIEKALDRLGDRFDFGDDDNDSEL